MSGWDRPGRGRLLWVLVLVLAGIALLTVNFLPVPADYHGDEGMWIASGKYAFQKAFLERDFRGEAWGLQYGNFGRMTPPVGHYIIGASLFLHGVVETTTDFSNHGPYVKWERSHAIELPPEILAAARAPMRWLFVGSVILLFFLVRELCGSSLLGFFAAALFSIRPLTLGFGRSAMLEMPLLFFCLPGLIVAARYLLKPDVERAAVRSRYIYGVGLLCGIAIDQGPGSYTGLRIGWAMAETLGFVLDTPVVGVCGLSGLALETAERTTHVAGSGDRGESLPPLAEMIGKGAGLYQSPEEVDQHIRNLRDEWDS